MCLNGFRAPQLSRSVRRLDWIIERRVALEAGRQHIVTRRLAFLVGSSQVSIAEDGVIMARWRAVT